MIYRTAITIAISVIGIVCLTKSQLSSAEIDIELTKERHLLPVTDFKEKGRGRPKAYYSDTYQSRARPSDDKAALEKKWGSWKLVDSTKRPSIDYSKYEQRDIPGSKFPKNAWQRDSAYLKDFLTETIALVERSMEAILTEYGKGKFDSNEDFEKRSEMFSITFDPTETGKNRYNYKNAGFTDKASWEGLKRRVLHSIVTEDTFTFVMGGHSAAAGHGNAFVQTYMPQVQRLIEPVFARLGVKFTAHNIGMGGLGTLQMSMGANKIYGEEIDMLRWDSGMTENGGPDTDVFMRQSILGSNRVPFLMDDRGIVDPYHTEMGADVGSFGFNSAGMLGIEEGKDEATIEKMPWAARGLHCAPELKPVCKAMEYRNVCWIDRDDVQPDQKQLGFVGGRAGWHPGERFHKLKGTTMAFVILRAMHEVLVQWKDTPNYLLPDEAWHIAPYYKAQMEKFPNVRLENCLKSLAPDMVCTTRMNARTEMTPRANPEQTSLRSILKVGHGLLGNEPNLYDPPDVEIPHNYPPPEAFDAVSVIELGVDFAPNLARKESALKRRRLEASAPNGGRVLADNIKPGQGIWDESGCANDNCDGTLDSFCNRCGDCILSGHNDGRHGFHIDSLSGWIIMNLEGVEKGGIFLKFETWHSNNKATEGFECIDGAKDCSTGRFLRGESNTTVSDEDSSLYAHDTSMRHERMLGKAKVPDWCDDFKFEFAIDGKITAWTQAEFMEHHKQAQRVVEIVTILDDPNFTNKPKDVEVAVRFTDSCGRKTRNFSLTHVYWA